MFAELLVKKIGLPIAEKLRGWPISKYLKELNETQWYKPEQIKEIQEQKLAILLEHAYNTVPFYKQFFDDNCIDYKKIKSIDDLSILPIITKDDIKVNIDNFISSQYDKSKLTKATSSGSTGEPFIYFISENEKARKWATLYRLWTWGGYEIGDRYVNLVAGAHKAFKSNIFLQYLESRFSGMLLLKANELKDSNIKDYVKEIAHSNPVMIRGYASSLYFLAQRIKENNIDLKLNSVFTTGETLYDFQRSVMEDAYQCAIFDTYGGEGMVISGQCDKGSMHICAESVIIEIVDSNGNPCKPGENGQVVLTDLNRFSMPFIRYNILDIASLSDELCCCGRGLPLIRNLEGRITDIGITPSGKSIVVHFFTGMFMKLAPKVQMFQVIQEKPDLFTILIVKGKGFEEVREDITKQTTEYLGDDVTLELRVVDDIPLTSAGKRRLFISKCGINVTGSKVFE